jgi:membrane peptidoglycan carboxypeptidase
MVRHGAITQAEADAAFAEPLEYHSRQFDIQAAHFVLGPVKQELEARYGDEALYHDGLEVTTTLDLNLQNMGQQVIENRVSEFEQATGDNPLNGALMAIDPRTGEVLAYVGSRDYFRDDIQGRNDNIQALNSPGSTLKPFTYITAFQHGWGTQTGILDTPASVVDPSTGESFSPRNPDNQYHGIVPVAQALASSLNVTAFKAILFAGVSNVVDNLSKAGLTTLDDPRGYGPALTLGGVDIRMDDLTYAYSVLAGGGVMRGEEPVTPHKSGQRPLDPVVLLKVANSEGKVLDEFKQPEERRILGANYVYMATSILSTPSNFCITYVLQCGGSGLGLADRPSAVKTGTSEPYVDSRAIGETWTFGFTPNLVAGVWAGYSDNSPIPAILSTSISWPAWRDFMTEAVKMLDLEPAPFARPTGVEERAVCWPSGKLATDACPSDRRTSSLFASDSIPAGGAQLAAITDSWWQKVRIDTRTGLLAASNTPERFVKEESRLVLPQDELAAWPGLRDWVLSKGAQLAPTEADSAAAASAVAINSPSSGSQVSGSVTVSGKADSPDFQHYVLEFGSGDNPGNWITIQESDSRVGGGTLGTWDTKSLSNGTYTLRLRLTDAHLGELRTVTTVQVNTSASNRNAGSGGNGDTPSQPTATITSPASGSTVTGRVAIQGTAASPAYVDAALEYGEGESPTDWKTIDRIGSAVKGGTLGNWNTSNLDPGVYTLRLTVRDRSLGNVQTTATVTVH